MADQGKTNNGAGKFVNSVAKGLNTDTTGATQPEGTYRWALNAMSESESGDLGFLTNEHGNYSCGDVGADWAIVGHVYIEDDEAIAFLAPKKNRVGDPLYGQGRIVKIKNDCTVEILLTSDCLNFNITKQIQCIYRVRNGCEINLYWTDNYNDIRHINLDSLEDYLKEGLEEYIADNPTTYTTDVNIWDCEGMKLFPDYSMPCINFVELNEGGSLDAGVYQFAVQYLDQDFNPTNWTPLTQPIPVYDSKISAGALAIKGSNPGSINPDGSVGGNSTNKAIVLKFTNLDTSFKFLRVATWASTAGVGGNVEGGRILVEIPISGSEEIFSFGEYNPVSTTVISREELTIPKKIFRKAKTIAQHSNRLLLGGVEENTIPHIELARMAQQIHLTYTTKTLGAEDAREDSVQSGKFYFDYRPYMRDEIYAFGIVLIYKDGSESPAYHIPCRRKNVGGDGAALITSGDYNNPTASGYTMGQHNREAATNGWDSSVICDAASFPSTKNVNVHHYEPNDATSNGDIERWEVYNTAVRTFEGYDLSGSYMTKGEMGYYECRNYRYPDTRDCDGVPIYPHTGSGTQQDPYVMDFVRHHRMPDTTLEPHFYGNPGITASNVGNLGDNPFSSAQEPKIATLGIEASNIQIPDSIKEDIQGYRIVRAKTSGQDRTVLDKGIVYYIHQAFKYWMGRKTDNGGLAPSQCAVQFQGNMFNKQLPSFACVHMSDTDKWKSSDYLKSPATFFQGQDGSVSLAADNFYGHKYGEKEIPWHGFVLKTDNILDCIWPDNNEDEAQLMAPLISIANYYWNDMGGGLKADRKETGAGYPLHGWGWAAPDVDGDYQYHTSVGDGVNVGYFTDTIVYPNAVIGYHGPLAKFGDINEAQYFKVERVLMGYISPIVCNTACCSNDVSPPVTNTGTIAGIGGVSSGRNDEWPDVDKKGGTTYIYMRASYQQSAVPYHNMQTGMGEWSTEWEVAPDWYGNNDTIWSKNVMYQYPMSNILIGDYVKLEANSGRALIPTMGTAPFDMTSQQEVMLAIGKTKDSSTEWGNIPFAWPWPGNNSGFTDIPYDTAWSRKSCDSLYDPQAALYSATFFQELFNGTFSATNFFLGSAGFVSTIIANLWGALFQNDEDEEEESTPGLVNTYYVSLKKNAYDAYGSIGNLVYIPTHNCMLPLTEESVALGASSGPVYGGDSFISRFAFKQTHEGARGGKKIRYSDDDKCLEHAANDDIAFGPGGLSKVREKDSGNLSKRAGVFNHLSWYWTESYINTELRLGNDTWGERIYPYHFESSAGGYGAISFVDDASVQDQGKPFTDSDTGDQSPNYYAMNKDYNKVNDEFIYSPLPLQFDFCNDCQQSFPYRLVYSDQSFQEEQRDLYKSFLANNYRDIPAHRGIVWNLWTLDNAVFIHTAESLWRIDPSRQLMPSSEGEANVHIGTGAFFSNEVREILQSDQGYLGSQSQWATLKTESGTFWPDERQGQIFLQQQSPKNTTNVGMRSFFEANMPIDIYKQYKDIYGIDFPFIDNPANPNGAGFVSVYDVRHNRFILTKKDYKLRAPWDTTDPANPYYRVISADPYSGGWAITGGTEGDCDCPTNPAWSANTNYAVTQTSEGCEHTWEETIITQEIEKIPSNTDIWVFYDTTSMGAEVKRVAKDSIVAWVANEQSGGGLLENWTGTLNHVDKGQPEEWVKWPMQAMQNSQDALCICLIDESSSRYHSSSGTYATERTPSWDLDATTYKAVYNSFIAGGGTITSLVYPVANHPVKSNFVLHAFSALHGSNVTSYPVHANGNPIDPYSGANSEQIGVSSYGAGFVDLSPSLGANPYIGEDPLIDFGWLGVWDKREDADFGQPLADDIGQFVSAQTNIVNVENTVFVEKLVPCSYETLGAGDGICTTCGDSTLATPIDIKLNDDTIVTISDISDIFECTGWTASYSVGMNHWVSFHGYMPNYYIGTRNHFYSGLNITSMSNIYRHGLNADKNNYQTFYGCLQPHIIDIISNDTPLGVNIYDTFHFFTDSSYYDGATGQYIDDRYTTFDSAYLYNDYQITDTINFIVKDMNVSTMMEVSVGESYNSCVLDRKERLWAFNNFRDMAVGRDSGISLFSKEWSLLASQPYMDKVINPLAVSTQKSWFELQHMRDKYLGIRLFFSNLAGSGKHKLVTNYMIGSAQQNVR